MSTGNRRPQGLMIFAVTALIGFAAVYFTIAGRDNATSPDLDEKSQKTAFDAAQGPRGTGKMAAFVTKKAPEPLPDITFKNGEGTTLKLSDFKGRTILLNLWATWCGPCREEMPSLDRLQKELGSDKFEVVALSLDRQGADAAKKFLDEVKVTNLKLYIDESARQASALKIIGMPTTILIDRDGNEIGRLAGPAEWDSADAKKLIEAALK